MKEIGGYFGFEKFSGKEYHSDAVPLNNGRNALYYLIKVKKIKKIYIPFYLCDSVSDLLENKGCDFEYYKIQSDFWPDIDKNMGENEYLYVVNYYGQLSDGSIRELKSRYGNIIIDNIQAFFNRPLEGVDTIYSCRKYFGVPDGAYLATDKRMDDELAKDISKNRMTHILGRFEGEASKYYDDYKEINSLYSEEPLKTMSNLTQNILRAIDYNQVRITRDNNYEFLEKKLGKINKLHLSTPPGPFAYPFYIENGIEIRKRLALKKIYIPTLWPNVLSSNNEETIEFQYAANILPLPCDQRYNLEDMKYMAELLKENLIELSVKH